MLRTFFVFQMNLPENQEMRLLEVVGAKIFTVMRPEMSIDLISNHNATSKIYRIEAVPDDQKDVSNTIFMALL